jgi:hypothetical protein
LAEALGYAPSNWAALARYTEAGFFPLFPPFFLFFLFFAAEPRALWPRVVLSHVLLQEGQDWQGAERALCDVLALDPRHAEAHRNLAVLRRQRAAAASA